MDFTNLKHNQNLIFGFKTRIPTYVSNFLSCVNALRLPGRSSRHRCRPGGCSPSSGGWPGRWRPSWSPGSESSCPPRWRKEAACTRRLPSLKVWTTTDFLIVKKILYDQKFRNHSTIGETCEIQEGLIFKSQYLPQDKPIVCCFVEN